MARKYRIRTSLLEVLAPQMIALLRSSAAPLLAREVGAQLGLRGGHEEIRRVVRDIARYSRAELGERICASQVDGYWLARSPGEWANYLVAEKTKTIFRFVQLRQMREAAKEKSSGQGRLFGRDERTEGHRDAEARMAWARV